MITAIIYNSLEDCQTLIDKLWPVIEPPYAPEGTTKPEPIKHPSEDKWCYVIKTYGYYYEKESTVLTQEEIDSITELSEDWIEG